VEVHEEAGPSTGEFQISEELSLVDRENVFDGFQLDDQISLNQEVDAVAAFDTEALVVHGKELLPFERKATQRELVCEALFIGRFEEPGSNDAMNFDARCNDLRRTILKPSVLRSFLFHPAPSDEAGKALSQK
jgi:hypothetical protein